MFRYTLKKDKSNSETGFRYRGTSTSRLEALTDTVFGFSITLLVVSLEVPKTYLELQASMYGFIGFIFCTMLLLSIWNKHYMFFLKYGIEDSITKYLNFGLLFLLLYYVFPLKYLFNYVGTGLWLSIKMMFNDNSPALLLKVKELNQAALNSAEWFDLTINFALGLFAIELIFTILYWNAYKKREILELNELEVAETKVDLWSQTIKLGVPLLSALVVVFFGGKAAIQAGMVYLLIPILILVFNKTVRKKIMIKTTT